MSTEGHAAGRQVPGSGLLTPIRIDGSVQRSFLFPAELETAINFYQNYPKIFRYLTHIHIDKIFSESQFRLKYETVELGLYRVKIFCQIQAEVIPDENRLEIQTINFAEKTPPANGIYSATSGGEFSSISQFERYRHQTIVHYQISLRADLPTPYGLKLIPEATRNRLSAGITRYRMQEIAGTFIKQSIEGFLRTSANSDD